MSDGSVRVLPVMPMEAFPIERGDVFRHVAAGAGGFGAPTERDPEHVLEDVLDGKVTVHAAADDYGVIIDARTLAIDWEATERCRAGLSPSPPGLVAQGGGDHAA